LRKELLLHMHIADDATKKRVLHVGCGNSLMGVEIQLQFKDRVHVVNSDVSPSVIDGMRKLYPEFEWIVDDASQLPVDGGILSTFDIVLDKGTLDLFCCVEGVRKDKIAAVKGYLEYCVANLKKGGRWVGVSFGMPESRLGLIKSALKEIGVEYELTDNFVEVNREEASGEGKGVSRVYLYTIVLA